MTSETLNLQWFYLWSLSCSSPQFHKSKSTNEAWEGQDTREPEQGKDNKKRLEGWEIQLLKDLSPTYLVRSVDNSPSRLLRTRHVCCLFDQTLQPSLVERPSN